MYTLQMSLAQLVYTKVALEKAKALTEEFLVTTKRKYPENKESIEMVLETYTKTLAVIDKALPTSK
jgi:uncharacterized protein YdhG (YjbR/CyaY superfamily)